MFRSEYSVSRLGVQFSGVRSTVFRHKEYMFGAEEYIIWGMGSPVFGNLSTTFECLEIGITVFGNAEYSI